MTNYISFGRCSQASFPGLAAHVIEGLDDMELMLPLHSSSKEQKKEHFQKTQKKLGREYES